MPPDEKQAGRNRSCAPLMRLVSIRPEEAPMKPECRCYRRAAFRLLGAGPRLSLGQTSTMNRVSFFARSDRVSYTFLGRGVSFLSHRNHGAE